MLIEVDDEVLLRLQLAAQLVRGHIHDVALLGLGDLVGLHIECSGII